MSVIDRATSGLAANDRALAHAITAEVLRRLPDLDALIDGATQRRLPDDAKARMVLRIALAQALVLGTPPHAAVATALPLLAGGPRRLVHGVFGAVLRSGARLPEVPTLPPETAVRWGRAMGRRCGRGGGPRYRRTAAARPVAPGTPWRPRSIAGGTGG